MLRVCYRMKVFLTGSTGFVGSHLLRRLLSDGHQVRALVRRHGNLLSHPGSLEEVEGDLASENLSPSLDGCDAVINLVGIIYEQGRSTFEAVHHIGTRNLVTAARKNGVERFVQMSALGARATNATAYHMTKFAAEEEIRNSGIPYVILRPSLIFGPGSAFVKQMIGLMRAVPFIRPVAGSGEYRFRPIHVTDVVECFARSLTNPAAMNRTVELAGGEEVTLNELTSALAECLRIRKAPVHIPMPLMKTAAAIFSWLPIKPPVTSVQLRMLEEGSTADSAPMKEIFGIEPIRFREGIKRDLSC
jgi:NADH dehydrogenase